MSRKCRKLQLRALVGRFGSQNAMVGRLDDLGAGPQPSLISTKYKCGDERNWSFYAFEHYNPQDVDKYIHSLVQI